MEKKKEQPDLAEIVNELAPEKIQKRIIEPYAKAHEKYKLEKVTVGSFNEFKKIITGYMQHHHKQLHNTTMPEDIAYSQAENILEHVLKGGFKQAYDLARRGELRTVIESLSSALRNQRIGEYTKHQITRIDPFDFNQHVNLARQYLSRYGQHLKDAGIESQKPEALAKDYKTLIENHVEMINDLSDKVGQYNKGKKDKK